MYADLLFDFEREIRVEFIHKQLALQLIVNVLFEGIIDVEINFSSDVDHLSKSRICDVISTDFEHRRAVK